MKKVIVVLEFDEKQLGEKWLNKDNLELLLYSDTYTRRDLLKIISYEEVNTNVDTTKKKNSYKDEIKLQISSQQLAEQFHKYYEELASKYGYETREDTRVFDPESSNGKLMIAVSEKILKWLFS